MACNSRLAEEVSVGSDLKYAWRSIWKSPATTIGAMLALALGLGATTMIFGLFNAVLLRPLPYPHAERLVEIFGTVQREQTERRGTSFPDFFDWRDRSKSYDGMAAWMSSGFIIYGAGQPELVRAEIIDGPYFELLGVQAVAGRMFLDSDHRPAASPVAVIGERLWEERFNRSAEAIGRTLQLDSRVFTIVGVAPASFRGRSDQAVVWTPVRTSFAPDALNQRGNRSFPALARLKEGVSLETAQAEMHAINAQLERAYFSTNEKRSAEVSPLANEVFQNVRPAVSLLLGAVVLVLLIACANVASLLLARGESRRREMSLRRAIGAEDGQLVRLLLLESAMLVVLGGGLGLLLAQWTSAALLALSPGAAPEFCGARGGLAHSRVRRGDWRADHGRYRTDAAEKPRQRIAVAIVARGRAHVSRRRSRVNLATHRDRRGRRCSGTPSWRSLAGPQLCGPARLRSGFQARGCVDDASAATGAAVEPR